MNKFNLKLPPIIMTMGPENLNIYFKLDCRRAREGRDRRLTELDWLSLAY